MGIKDYVIIGVIAAILCGGVYAKIYRDGEKHQVAKQIVAQKKHEKKVHKDYADVDKKTPFAGDRTTQLEWLRGRATRQ